MPKGPFTLSTRSSRGFAATIANLHAANARVQDAVKREVKSSGFRLQRRAKDKAPEDSGHLKKSIRLEFTEGKLAYQVGWREEDFRGVTVSLTVPKGQRRNPEAKRSATVGYYMFTEFGTRFMAPRPCLFPARAEEVPVFKEKVVTAVRDALKKSRRRGR